MLSLPVHALQPPRLVRRLLRRRRHPHDSRRLRGQRPRRQLLFAAWAPCERERCMRNSGRSAASRPPRTPRPKAKAVVVHPSPKGNRLRPWRRCRPVAAAPRRCARGCRGQSPGVSSAPRCARPTPARRRRSPRRAGMGPGCPDQGVGPATGPVRWAACRVSCTRGASAGIAPRPLRPAAGKRGGRG